MVSFPKKEVVSMNIDEFQSLVENSMVHIVSASHKRGILELKEDCVRLILGLLNVWISTASTSIKSHVNLMWCHNVSEQLDDGFFPKERGCEYVNFDEFQPLVENSTVHIVSASQKRGILELKENYVRLILGLLYAWISTASTSIKSYINLIWCQMLVSN